MLLSSCECRETSLSSGQTLGFGSRYQATPIRTNVQFKVITSEPVQVSMGPELVTDVISQPQSGYLVGVCPDLKLSCHYQNWTWFCDGGAGPTYFSIPTPEQGKPGFNFLDQVGTGAEYRLTEQLSLGVKYRLSHISDAGIRQIPNHGINANTGMVAVRFDF